VQLAPSQETAWSGLPEPCWLVQDSRPRLRQLWQTKFSVSCRMASLPPFHRSIRCSEKRFSMPLPIGTATLPPDYGLKATKTRSVTRVLSSRSRGSWGHNAEASVQPPRNAQWPDALETLRSIVRTKRGKRQTSIQSPRSHYRRPLVLWCSPEEYRSPSPKIWGRGCNYE